MASTPLTAEQIDRHAAVLASSTDRAQLLASTLALASSGRPDGVDALGGFLKQQEFLARLDALDEPQLKLGHLRQVLSELEKHPSEATGRLCESLATSPDFRADPDRMIFLLPALAAVRPLSEDGAAIFTASCAEGRFNGNGPLLVANSSPRALSIFEQMVANTSVSVANRIDMLHWALPAHRTNPGIAESAMRIVDRGIEPEVEAALCEALFDYQGDEWFGVARHAPVPVPWQSAETAVLQSYVKLGDHLRRTRRFPDAISDAIERTLHEMTEILAAR